MLTGSSDPEKQPNPKAKRALERNPALSARINRSKKECLTEGGETLLVWKPELERVKRVILKNARGHAFYEHGEPVLTDPEYIWALPLERLTAKEREDFENLGGEESCWPEVGSRMMTRLVSGQDMVDGWIIVQENIYRYSIIMESGLTVRTVLHEYLATETHWEN